MRRAGHRRPAARASPSAPGPTRRWCATCRTTRPGGPPSTPRSAGLCYAEISVRTLERDLHSGTYGGVAPNALETLVRLLARLKDADGEIRIPKLYKAVEPPDQGGAQDLEAAPVRQGGLPRARRSPARRSPASRSTRSSSASGRCPPSRSTASGAASWARAPRRSFPRRPTAKVSLRLVPGQSYAKVGRQLERAVAELAPRWADVKVTLLHGGDPVQVDVDHPAFAVLDEAFEAVTWAAARCGCGPAAPSPSSRSSASPGAPVMLTGIGLPDDGLHSPNEKLDLAQLWSGIRDLRTVLRVVRGEGASGGGSRRPPGEAQEAAPSRLRRSRAPPPGPPA